MLSTLRRGELCSPVTQLTANCHSEQSEESQNPYHASVILRCKHRRISKNLRFQGSLVQRELSLQVTEGLFFNTSALIKGSLVQRDELPAQKEKKALIMLFRGEMSEDISRPNGARGQRPPCFARDLSLQVTEGLYHPLSTPPLCHSERK